MMTSGHLSIKIGRFMCDAVRSSGFLGDTQRLTSAATHQNRQKVKDSGFSGSTGNAHLSCRQQFNQMDQNDAQNGASFSHLETEEGEGSDEEDGDQEERDGDEFFQWTDDNSRTLLPEENDRMSRLFIKIIQPTDDEAENSSSRRLADDGDEDAYSDEEEEGPLPWRSQDDTVAVEDAAKYHVDVDDFWNGGDATPKVSGPEKVFISDQESVDHHPQSPHLSSFWNLHPRPSQEEQLSSMCRSSLTQSHWLLSEAESRHSEPYNCPQHHHVLLGTTSSSSLGIERCPSSSLFERSRNAELQLQQSSSSAAILDHHEEHLVSSSEIDLENEEAEVMTRHEQVFFWLMNNDLIGSAEDGDHDNNSVEGKRIFRLDIVDGYHDD